MVGWFAGLRICRWAGWLVGWWELAGWCGLVWAYGLLVGFGLGLFKVEPRCVWVHMGLGEKGVSAVRLRAAHTSRIPKSCFGLGLDW